jgi:hypothetical protein
MNLETQQAFDEFHAMLSPVVRAINQKLVRLQGDIQSIENLPLPERILAWREWNRLCRPPLTSSCAANPHANA